MFCKSVATDNGVFYWGGVVLLCFDNITAVQICQPVDIQIVNIHKMQKGFRKNIVFFPESLFTLL